MTAQALKQAALDHLAAESASACSLPLGEDVFVCVGTKEAIAGLVAPGSALKANRLQAQVDHLLDNLVMPLKDSEGMTWYVVKNNLMFTNMVEALMRIRATPPVDKDQS